MLRIAPKYNQDASLGEETGFLSSQQEAVDHDSICLLLGVEGTFSGLGKDSWEAGMQKRWGSISDWRGLESGQS